MTGEERGKRLHEAYEGIKGAYRKIGRTNAHPATAMAVNLWSITGKFDDVETLMLLAYNDGLFAGSNPIEDFTSADSLDLDDIGGEE